MSVRDLYAAVAKTLQAISTIGVARKHAWCATLTATGSADSPASDANIHPMVTAPQGFIFLFADAMPKNWKPWWYFIADAHGLRFPSQCPQTKKSQWLSVPWDRVGTVKKESFYDR
jgi:hypothetical protein